MRQDMLGAFYEIKQRQIHSLLLEDSNNSASIHDVCKSIGLSKSEVDEIVDSDLDLNYDGNYIQRR